MTGEAALALGQAPAPFGRGQVGAPQSRDGGEHRERGHGDERQRAAHHETRTRVEAGALTRVEARTHLPASSFAPVTSMPRTPPRSDSVPVISTIEPAIVLSLL